MSTEPQAAEQPPQLTAEQKQAKDMKFAEVFAYLQTTALETQDARIQDLANTAFGQLDETVLRAVLIQKFAAETVENSPDFQRQQQQQYQQQFQNNPFNRTNRR